MEDVETSCPFALVESRELAMFGSQRVEIVWSVLDAFCAVNSSATVEEACERKPLANVCSGVQRFASVVRGMVVEELRR